VTAAKKVHRTTDRGEHFLEASLCWILARKHCVVHIRKRLQHAGPTLNEGIANDILRRVPTILRNARRAVFEVLIAERHDNLEVGAADHLKDAICVDREMADAEGWMVHVLRGHLAETIRGDRLHEVVGVTKRQREA